MLVTCVLNLEAVGGHSIIAQVAWQVGRMTFTIDVLWKNNYVPTNILHYYTFKKNLKKSL